MVSDFEQCGSDLMDKRACESEGMLSVRFGFLGACALYAVKMCPTKLLDHFLFLKLNLLKEEKILWFLYFPFPIAFNTSTWSRLL